MLVAVVVFVVKFFVSAATQATATAKINKQTYNLRPKEIDNHSDVMLSQRASNLIRSNLMLNLESFGVVLGNLAACLCVGKNVAQTAIKTACRSLNDYSRGCTDSSEAIVMQPKIGV